jgi:hypothetical protein
MAEITEIPSGRVYRVTLRDPVVMPAKRVSVTVRSLVDSATPGTWTGHTVIPSPEVATISEVGFVTAPHPRSARP